MWEESGTRLVFSSVLMLPVLGLNMAVWLVCSIEQNKIVWSVNLYLTHALEGDTHLWLLHKEAHHKRGYSGTLQSICDSPRNRQFFCVSVKDCLV